MSTTETTQRPLSILSATLPVWSVLVLLAIAFFGGFVVRGLDSGGPPTRTEGPVIVPAPPLDGDQLGGVLPPDHPPIGGSAADEGTS